MPPTQQTAVQLVGPDRLALTHAKRVPTPGPTQILGQVDCVGLCASDMKLLHQYERHARKTPVLAHLGQEVLAQIPSYVPNGAPTVPGHEAVIRVVAIGEAVRTVEIGKRYLVQADFRDLKTANSNGAFGYNFEGGLQQYVLLDERVTVAANGDSYLLPVPDQRSASQIALVEPWACVEDAFRVSERRALTQGGTLLLAGSADLTGLDLARPARLLCLGPPPDPRFTRVAVDAPNQFQIDDLLVGGADAGQLERLLPLLSKNGLLLLATGGQRFGRPVIMPIGRVHYGNIRLAATTGTRFAEALASIPTNGELRPGDHVNVVGAGGPMGVMAMVRAIASSQPGSLVEGGVRNPARAEALRQRVAPLAAARGVALRLFNPATETPRGPVHYCFLMAPAPELLGAIIAEAAPRGLINVFAGIAADLPCPIDLDTVAAKQLYFIGTSGSTLEDMHVVLGKVLAGSLDTNLSVGAVSGMAGAIAGLHAVRDKSIAGKIVVYPQLDDLPLLELDALVQRYPTLAPLLADGCWTKAAEDELLRVARTR